MEGSEAMNRSAIAAILLQRLDLNMDNMLTIVGDVLKFSGKIGQRCT